MVEFLTPGYFLKGELLKCIPEYQWSGNISGLVEEANNSTDALQRRTKWFRPSRNFKEGNVIDIFNRSLLRLSKADLELAGVFSQVSIQKFFISANNFIRTRKVELNYVIFRLFIKRKNSDFLD